MDLNDWVGSVGGTIGALSSLYTWIEARKKKREEEFAKENPIRMSMTVEYAYETRTVRYTVPTKIKERFLGVRVTNASGKPISIEKPYLEAADGSRTDIESAETYPLRLEQAATITLRSPLDDVLDDYVDLPEVELRAVCRVVGVDEFVGEWRVFRNDRHVDAGTV